MMMRLRSLCGQVTMGLMEENLLLYTWKDMKKNQVWKCSGDTDDEYIR